MEHAVDSREMPHSYTRDSWEKETSRHAIAYHLTMRLVDDRAIARTTEALRVASREVRKHGRRRGLLLYRFADTHLHVVCVGTREQAGKLARYTENGLRRALRIPVPFQRSRIRPIRDERHLLYTLRYIYRQEAHHGTAFDEAHDGSSLPDVLGLRCGAAWLAERLRLALPRVTRPELLELLQAPGLESVEPDLEHVREAAAATWCVASLEGNTVDHVRARRLAVQLLHRVAPGVRIADVFPLHAWTLARYLREPVPPCEMRAAELQLKLRTLLSRRRMASESAALV